MWFVDNVGENIVIYYEYQGKTYTVAQIETSVNSSIELNSSMLPSEIRSVIESSSWTPPMIDGSVLNDINLDVWGNFSADAKMLTFSASAVAVIALAFEIDIVTINPNADSEDAGKTFAYLSIGGGVGLAAQNLAGVIAWDVALLKGKVDYIENNSQNVELDREMFTGWAFAKTGSIIWYEKSSVRSYGACWEGCMDCIVTDGCQEDLVYSAELTGVSLSEASNVMNGSKGTVEVDKKKLPSASGMITSMHSWLIDELEFLETDPKTSIENEE